MLRLGIAIVLFFIFYSSNGQECFQYYLEHCIPEKSKFSYDINDKSTSFLFSSGETHEISFILQNGKDYRFQICADLVFENIIKFQIISSDKNRIIYTNDSDNFSLNIEFENRKTQEVKLVLSSPEIAAGISDTINYEGCVGLLIEEMITIKTGF